MNDWTQTRELGSALFSQTLMGGETLAVASNQNVGLSKEKCVRMPP